MKRITFITAAFGLLTCHYQAEAQSNYFSLQTGYAIGVAQDVNQNYIQKESSGPETSENDYYSYGEGIQVKLSYGHMFNEAFGVELGMSQLFGKEHESTYEYSDSKSTNRDKVSLTIINPSIIYSFNNKRLSPYAKFGVCGSFGSVTSNSSSVSSNSSYSDEYNITSKLNLGITSALGASFKLTDNLSLLGEASFMSSTFNPKKLTTTKSFSNDEDQLPNMTTREKEAVFVDEVTYDSDQEASEDQPDEYPSMKLPLSNLAFSIGIKYSF